MGWQKNYLTEIYRWRFGDRRNVIKLPESAIIGLGGSASRIAKHLKYRKKLGQSFVGEYKGKKIGVIACGMGTAEIETTMVAISNSPAKQIIGIGWAGAIDPKISVGDLILPTIALRGENTTDYYLPSGINISADKILNQKLELSLIKSGCNYFKGSIFTTPAPGRETPQFVKIMRDNNIIGVEMECSVLFTLAKLQRKRATALLVVSDNILTAKSHIVDSHSETKEVKAFNLAVKSALDVLTER